MQNNNVYERIHSALSWKRIIAFNVILFLITVIPLSVRLAQEDTENRSSAAEDTTPIVTPPPSYSSEPPVIERVSEWFGKKGDTVIVLGRNFGEYQWASKIYIGNVEANPTNIIRWSNNVLEVQIPEQARTGKVWIVVNNHQSTWEGSLLLTDVARSAQITLSKINTTTGSVNLRNGAGVTSGMIEIAHVSEPLSVISPLGKVTSNSTEVDSLGKKTRVEFSLEKPLGSNTAEILQIGYPGIGSVEILRTELYNTAGGLIPVYADPFGVKIN